MAVLEKSKQDKIDELSNRSYEYYESGNKIKSYELMEQAWETYPNPPENWNESFNTAKYAFDDLLNDKVLDRASVWFERMTKIQNNLGLWDGLYQFYSGKLYFELGQFGKAKQMFEDSVKIGKGLRYFENENPKYLDFYNNPENLIDNK
ncbi:MAG: hypothetical protein ACK5IC_05475 [Moheibacter sp.]